MESRSHHAAASRMVSLGAVRVSMPTWAFPSVQWLDANEDFIGRISEDGQWLNKVWVDQQNLVNDLYFL